jgi:hypothetical protein
VVGLRPQRTQPVLRRRQLAQFPYRRGRHAPAGDVLRDPVAKVSRAVLDVVQVEPAEHRAIVADEHVVGADAGLPPGQQLVVLLGELVEELIAAVGNESGEVGAVRQFEGQHRRGMVGAQALQLGHRPTLLR